MSINYLKLAEDLRDNNINMKIYVIGSSMSPILRKGNKIYVEPVEISDLSVGDIVLYRRGENMVAHRLVGIEQKNNGFIFLTKGDTFSSEDEPLREKDIIGRVYAVEKRGITLNLRKGLFSVLSRLAYSTSSFTSVLYSIRRWNF